MFVPGSTYIAHVATADPQDLGAWTGGGQIAGDGLGLLHAAPDNAGVGAQVDEGSRLRATDGAGAARDECDSALYTKTSGQAVSSSGTGHTRPPNRGRTNPPKMPSFHTDERYSDRGIDMVARGAAGATRKRVESEKHSAFGPCRSRAHVRDSNQS